MSLHTTWASITPAITYDDVHYPSQGLEMHGYVNKTPVLTLHVANRDGEFFKSEDDLLHEMQAECIESLQCTN